MVEVVAETGTAVEVAMVAVEETAMAGTGTGTEAEILGEAAVEVALALEEAGASGKASQWWAFNTLCFSWESRLCEAGLCGSVWLQYHA